MLEAGLRDYIADPTQAKKLLEGIDRVLDIAVGEDDKMVVPAMKLLLDRVMPAMPPKLEEDADRTDRKLTIVVQTNPNATMPIRAVVEGDYTTIEEKPNG